MADVSSSSMETEVGRLDRDLEGVRSVSEDQLWISCSIEDNVGFGLETDSRFVRQCQIRGHQCPMRFAPLPRTVYLVIRVVDEKNPKQ